MGTLKVFDLFFDFPVYYKLKVSSLYYEEAVAYFSGFKDKLPFSDGSVEHFVFNILELAFWEVVEDEVIF